jgi:proliferating cell nuclear antigen
MSSNQETEEVELDTRLKSKVLEDLVDPPVRLAGEDTAKFTWSENGLRVKVVDGANVIMVDQFIDQEDFEAFSLDIPEDTFSLGLPCDRLQKLINSADSRDIVQLKYLADSNRLGIRFGKVKYQLSPVVISSLMEADSDELEHDYEVAVQGRIFGNAAEIFQMVSPAVSFDFSGSSPVVSASGDSDEATISLSAASDRQEFESEQADLLLIDEDIDISSEYGIDYIEHLSHMVPNESVTMKIDEDYPMKLDLARSNGDIQTEIVLAPRIG